MTAERWAQIQQIFDAALDQPIAERPTFLREACAGDELLGREVAKLLEHAHAASLPNSAAELHRLFDTELNVGEVVAHYRVEEKVGEGGMGAVYRAYDTELHRQVGLKVLHRHLEIDDEGREALLREARAASALDHPNIGTIFAIEAAAGKARFIVMAYYEGQTLAQKLKAGPLPAKEAAAIALQIARGLAEAHAHGIIHRDIKPSNLFLTRQGLVKILDFGLARAVRSETSTLSAKVAGTATYMSPEQAQSKYLDARTDLWSLGAVLYEMVAGWRAFSGDDVPATLFQIVHEAPAPLGEEVPERLQKIIKRALEKQPEDRYQSAAAMIHDLRQIAETDAAVSDPTATMDEAGEATHAGPGVNWRRWRRYLWWLSAPVVLLLLTAGLLNLKNGAGPNQAAYQSYLKAEPYLQRYATVENLDQAIVLLKQTVKADPAFALGFAALGDAYRRKFDLTQDQQLLAAAEFNAGRALTLNDSIARIHVVMGGVHAASGHMDLAQHEYQAACKLEPKNVDALSGLAGAYAANQRIADAEALYRQAVALRPDSWDVYNNFGRFLKEHQKPEEAAEQFRLVIARDPKGVAGYLNLAAALLSAGKLDEAEPPLKEAMEFGQASWAVHINQGDLYFRRHLYAQAEKETLRGIDASPNYWGGWVNLAVIYRWWGKEGQAREAYQKGIPRAEKWLQDHDTDAATWGELARMYAYLGDKTKAASAMEKALALDSENPDVLLSCADAHEDSGERRLAVEMANRAVAKGLRQATLDIDPSARWFRADPEFKPPSK